MEITAEQLAAALGCPLSRAKLWVSHINVAMAEYAINTKARVCAFIAQIGHESGRLQFVREIWNPAICEWQARYEGRKDLGNDQPGDGYKFRGRGLIQITGKANYTACGKALHVDFVSSPALLERSDYAAKSAAWFWQEHGCNQLADADRFEKITRTINGGLNGQADRLKIYENAQKVIQCH